MEDETYVIPTLDATFLSGLNNKFLDIPYCDISEKQKVDIYLPDEGIGPFPVIVHFHGGAFLFGTKRDINLKSMLRALKRGYAVVSVGYRLSGEARFPALIYDCKAAIRYIRGNSKVYNLDTERIAAWGPSAGGYLAAMIGTTGGNAAFEDLDMGYEAFSSDVKVVVDWCGPCGNFLDMDKSITENGIGLADHNDELSPESRLMGVQITKIPELVRLASPTTYVHKELPYFLIHHGEADPIVPVQQSIELADRIVAVAGNERVKLVTFEGRGHHGEPWYDTEEMSNLVFDYLAEHL